MLDNAKTWIGADQVGVLLFGLAFFVVAMWEAFNPARASTTSLSLRWFGNVALFVLAWAIGRVSALLPWDTATLIAQEPGGRLLDLSSWPGFIVAPLSFVALDFIGYWVHRLFHAVPILWRLHSLHHSDPDLDATTSVRHHPFEVLTQMPINAAAAFLLGLPPAAIIFYGTVVTAVQVFQHGNLELPARFRWIGIFVVTPTLHRIHHSSAYDENNSNFSNFLTLWDRLFGTLRRGARAPLRIGLPEVSSAKLQRLDRMLALPWFVTPIPERAAAVPVPEK